MWPSAIRQNFNDEPMPTLAAGMPGLPDRVVAIVDKCLAKKKAERYSTGALREVYFYPSQLAGHTEREYHPGS